MAMNPVPEVSKVGEVAAVPEPVEVPEQVLDLTARENYFNRELSHLQFNYRVLQQALDEHHPLINRLIFLCIFSSNMDEFFEIRVAGLRQQRSTVARWWGLTACYPNRCWRKSARWPMRTSANSTTFSTRC